MGSRRHLVERIFRIDRLQICFQQLNIYKKYIMYPQAVLFRMFYGNGGIAMGKKVEAFECDKCGAVYRTQEEVENCKTCAVSFCPEWKMNIKKKTCDECYDKRATGAGSYMAPENGKDPNEPGGMKKVVYSGSKCQYREEFLRNLGETKPKNELPEDAKKILQAMEDERKGREQEQLSPEDAKELVKKGKGILGDPHSQS